MTMTIISLFYDHKDSWAHDDFYHIGYFTRPKLQSGWVELAKTERPEIAKIIVGALQDYQDALGEEEV